MGACILHNKTHSECPNSHEVKRGKGMHPEQNERGSDSSGPLHGNAILGIT
jgi:hypothetical protein